MSGTPDGPLLLPIANTETVDRLLDTAIDIASARSMSIVAFKVVKVPPQLPLTEGDQLVSDEDRELIEYVEERAAHSDVRIETKTRFARDTASGIVGSVEVHDGGAMLVGWRGRPRRRDIVLGSFLDHILAEAPCDVFIKRIKLPNETLETILVPVAGGPHDELATDLAGWIASCHGAEIVLVHVESSDADEDEREQHRQLLEDRHGRLPDTVNVTTRVLEDAQPAGALTDLSSTHDLIILGATRSGFLGRKLVGSVAEEVGRSAATSVIVTRRYSHR